MKEEGENLKKILEPERTLPACGKEKGERCR